MKALVVFYSRTGMTRTVGKAISALLRCDIDEIKDKKDRNGMIGYVKAGRDAAMRKETGIEFKKDPGKYDMVIIGTPVWAWNMCPAVRSYLASFKDRIKDIAFFCTMHGVGDKKTFKEMQGLCGEPKAVLSVLEKEVKGKAYSDRLREFVDALKAP